MNKYFIFLFLSAFLLSANIVAAQTTYFSNGTSANTYGNTTYYSDGCTATTYGNQTYFSGPSGCSGTESTYGNTTYYNGNGNNNFTANTYGNTTYFSGNNGTNGTATTYGNTTYYSGNILNTCPANSSYDSLTSNCKCNYGYKSNGTSCIYSPSYYSTYSNYSATTATSCPVNSSYTATGCTCNAGYLASGDSCITDTQSCQNTYGPSSYGNASSCYCSAGSQFNSAKTYCVLNTQTEISAPSQPTNTTSSQSTASSCSTYGPGAELIGSLCYCSQNYKWNAAIRYCDAGNPIFSQYLSLGSTGTDVVNLKNFLAIEGLYNGRVDTPFDTVMMTAVKRLQSTFNISQTGTVGPLTRATINKFISGGY